MDTPLFYSIEIETHNRCTRHCWFCKFGQKRGDVSPRVLPDTLIEKIADNLQDLKFRGIISPFGINEPLLDPRMVDIIRLFRDKCPQAFISLSSNGDLLTEKLLHALMDAGLSALGLSIYDDAGWERLQPYGKYPNVRFYDMRPPARRLENRGGNVADTRFLSDMDVHRPCIRPFDMMIVHAEGLVCLCCSDLYSEVVMGDLAQQRLEEIWYSNRFRLYRAKLATTGRIGLQLCQRCSHDGTSCPEDYPLGIDEGWIPSSVKNYLKRRLPPSWQETIKGMLPRRWLPKGVHDLMWRNRLKSEIKDRRLWDEHEII